MQNLHAATVRDIRKAAVRRRGRPFVRIGSYRLSTYGGEGFAYHLRPRPQFYKRPSKWSLCAVPFFGLKVV